MALTPQQIAAATAKRKATAAANRAAGIPSVHAQRAAKRAAKANGGQAPPPPRQAAPPPPQAPPASAHYGSYASRNRRKAANANAGRGSSSGSYYTPPVQPQAPPVNRAPLFGTPKPTHRALKLVALAALEAAFVQKLVEKGRTPDVDDAFTKYKKIKALALGHAATAAAQNEADAALLHATVHLVKLAF
jgi:hypothetical protein